VSLNAHLLRAEEFSQVSKYSMRLLSGTLFVDTRVGDIRVEGWDQARVAVEAEKVVRASSPKKAEKLFSRIRVELHPDEEERAVLLRTVYPSRRLWRPFRGESRLSINLRIHMPSETNLDLRCVDGDVRIHGLTRRVELHVNYGDVEIVVPSVWDLRSLNARTWLGYVQSDLEGITQDSAGLAQRISFWNPSGGQEINVRVRMGGVFVYNGGD
jgi:hypothetical protein